MTDARIAVLAEGENQGKAVVWRNRSGFDWAFAFDQTDQDDGKKVASVDGSRKAAKKHDLVIIVIYSQELLE